MQRRILEEFYFLCCCGFPLSSPFEFASSLVSGSGKSVTNFIGIGAGGLVAVIALFGIVFFVMKKRQAGKSFLYIL